MAKVNKLSDFCQRLAACELRTEVKELAEETSDELLEWFVTAVGEFEEFFPLNARQRAIYAECRAVLNIRKMAES